MAKKSSCSSKGSLGHEYHNLTPEQKQKVNAACDQFPEFKKDMVAIVLNHHDFDLDKSIDALTSDGGSSAFTSWKNQMESSQTKANKNKKKNKKKNRKEDLQISNSIAVGGNDGDDSSSLHSSNIDFDPDKETNSKIGECDGHCEKFEKDSYDNFNNEYIETPSVPTAEDGLSEKSLLIATSENTPEQRLEVDKEFSNVESTEISADNEQGSTYYEANEEGESSNAKNTNSSPIIGKNEDHLRSLAQKHNYRQRHSSSQHSKSSSFSEDIQLNQPTTSKNRGGLVKCTKDLTRQTISLQRIELQLGNKLEDAGKSLKNMFAEARKMLDKRQAELEEQLNKVKVEAADLLRSRQDLASELKRKVDRANAMNETEWNELRADIKQFVTERKYDDELGKTIWFHWSMDDIKEVVSNMGEVHPVKNSYSQRQRTPSISKSPEPSGDCLTLKKGENTWLSGNKEENNIQSPLGSTNNSNNNVEENKFSKEMIGRSGSQNVPQGVRVFCSTRFIHGGGRYPNNRGRGFYRNHSGGYARGRHYDNWQYSGNDRHNDYRKQQHHHDRTDYSQSSVDKSGENQIHDSGNGAHSNSPFPSNARESHGHYSRGPYDKKPFPSYNRPPRVHNQYGKSRGINKMRFNSDTAGNSDTSLSKVENQETQQKRQDMYNGC